MEKTLAEGRKMNYYLPGQKREQRRKVFKAFLYGFVIAAFIFTGLGYAWRIAQVDDDHKSEVKRLKTSVQYYQDNWTPIKRHVEVKVKGH